MKRLLLLALVLSPGAAQAFYTCPPLATCFPKPVPVLDPAQLAIAADAVTAANNALTAWTEAQSLTRNLQSAIGAHGGLSLSIAKDPGLARALQLAAPAKLAGPTGDGFDVAQATLRATQARIETTLFTPHADATPIEMAQVTGARGAASRTSTSDALATSLVRRAAMSTESKEVADLKAARATARTLRDDVAVNQRARLALARRFDEVTLLLAQYLELAAANRLAAQPVAASFPAAARDAAPATVAEPARIGAQPLRLAEALRGASADTSRRRAASSDSAALTRDATAAIALASSNSADVRQTFPDVAQAETPMLDAGLRAIYADPATAKRVLYDAATAGADMAPWSRFSTAALSDADAAALSGEADLKQTWTRSVTASDGAMATLATDPSRGGPLLVTQEDAAASVAALRQSDALTELARWAQAKRLAAAHVEVRGWLDDAAQLAREAGAP
ncbi:hypothetical protein [Roseiterribacter gracilis]|uniref:Outer membrane efflux protein n=1 Tax=Roseiterribacter gracilis TaxID=2812848 RepID=A0A8S8XBR0_9PROT|nr:hypothetical protein TMPK1_36650 [Rhodospirillales bacterium TMPK1]